MRNRIPIIFLILFIGVIISAQMPSRDELIRKAPPRGTEEQIDEVKPESDTTADTKTEQETPAIDEIKSDLPKIPEKWGRLVNSEFVRDTAYLVMYFEDKKGNVRIAIFDMRKDVTLFRLLEFPRGKQDLKPQRK